MHTDKNVCCADSMFTLNDFDSDSDFDLDEQTTNSKTDLWAKSQRKRANLRQF